jgi:hypothetical protein
MTPERTQQMKNSLKDQSEWHSLEGMYLAHLFLQHFGTFPTVKVGMNAIISIANMVYPNLSFSDQQIRLVAALTFGSRHGKQSAGHTSITLFGPEGKIDTPQQLHSALYRFAAVAARVFGHHVHSAISSLHAFAFDNLEPLNGEIGTPSRLSLTQHVDLVNSCLYAIGHSSDAISAASPEDRWDLGCNLILGNDEVINGLASAHLATLLSAKRAPAKRSAAPSPAAKAAKKKPKRTPSDKTKTKTTTESASAEECRFFSRGQCRRGTGCPFLHDGTPAAQYDSSDSD